MQFSPHDAPPLQPVPSQIVATWPVGTFVENIAALPDGRFVVAIHSQNELQIVTSQGEKSALASLPLPPAGLVVVGETIFAACGVPGQSGGAIWKIALDGEAQMWIELEGALFPNGCTPFFAGHLLLADSIRGELWDIDLEARSAQVWLADNRLKPLGADSILPGVNGVKIHDFHVYFTNTDAAQLLRVPIRADGSAGAIELLAERFRGDDFAFDAQGALYVTTHLHAGVVRRTPDGEKIALAGWDQGLAGSTAAAFGRATGETHSLFVTTTGGIYQLNESDPIEAAKLVRLEVGASGLPIEFLKEIQA